MFDSNWIKWIVSELNGLICLFKYIVFGLTFNGLGAQAGDPNLTRQLELLALIQIVLVPTFSSDISFKIDSINFIK